MYDLGEFPRLRASVAAGAAYVRRWRLAAPMYDLRCTMYNTHDGPVEGARAADGGGRRGLPMYEVRWTMYDLDYSARYAGI